MNNREPFDQWWVDQVRQLDELSLYDLSRRAWQAATLAASHFTGNEHAGSTPARWPRIGMTQGSTP